MADYHAILRRAISAMPAANGETRRAVYEKARSALVAQLKAFDPPLSPSEITQQRLHLEEAIRKVESEAAKGLLKAAPAAPPVRPPEPAPEPVAAASHEPPAPPPSEASPPLGAPAPAAPTQMAPAPSSHLRQVVNEAEALGTATAELGRQTRGQLTEATPPAPPPAAAATFGRTGGEASKKRETKERKRRRERAVAGEGRTSRIPVVVGLSVAVIVFALGIVVLWTQREAISAYFGGAGEPVVDISKRGGEKLTPKATDRLSSDDGTAKPATSVKPVATQTITATPQLQSGETPPPDAGSMPAQQAVVPVAQKAILYEEGKAGAQALITTGRVVWQLVADPTAQRAGAMMIRIRAEIPDRHIVLNLAMRPNADTSFPASHLIEVRFDLPPDFDGKAVTNVPGMIFKGTEQARGDPLAAASAKVSDNLFWIALGAGEIERTRNFKLFKEKGWIDLPILYENGRRAILTLEKSGAGDQIVADAFTSWGQGG